jgi:hypothetical protein
MLLTCGTMNPKRKRGPKDEAGARNVLRNIALGPTENRIVNELLDELGMGKATLIERLVRWFAEQDELVQKTILGVAPKGQNAGAILATVFEAMAGELRKPRNSSSKPLRGLIGKVMVDAPREQH